MTDSDTTDETVTDEDTADETVTDTPEQPDSDETATDTEAESDDDSDETEHRRPALGRFARPALGRFARPALGRFARPALWSTAAALIIVLAGLSIFFWIQHRESTEVYDATPAVLTATREGATAILTYRAATVQADVDAAQKRLTGGFADEYRTLARTEVLPAANERGLSSTVNISGVSLVRSDADTAETMVFVTQQVSSDKQSEEPTTTATAVRVGLVNQDGHWLIDRFQPI